MDTNFEKVFQIVNAFSKNLSENELKALTQMIKKKDKANNDKNKMIIMEEIPYDFLRKLKIIIDKTLDNYVDPNEIWAFSGNKFVTFADLSDQELINIYYKKLLLEETDYRFANLHFSKELSKRRIDVRDNNELYCPKDIKEIQHLYEKRFIAINTAINKNPLIVYKNEVIGFVDYEIFCKVPLL